MLAVMWGIKWIVKKAIEVKVTLVAVMGREYNNIPFTFINTYTALHLQQTKKKNPIQMLKIFGAKQISLHKMYEFKYRFTPTLGLKRREWTPTTRLKFTWLEDST